MYRNLRLILFLFFILKNKNSAAHPAPVVNFEINKFCFGDTTFFSNTTETFRNVINVTPEYMWLIYQENSADSTYKNIYYSTDSTIKFIFPKCGKYMIVLNVDNGHASSLTRYIYIDTIAHAAFSHTGCGSQFVNMSVCFNTCKWDFGDGSTSNATSPVHYYKKSGKYKVSLSVSGNNKTHVVSDSIRIDAVNDLDADFTATVLADSVLFKCKDTTRRQYTTYDWSFGDSKVLRWDSIYPGIKLYHKYPKKDSSYTVFFLIRSACFSAFSDKVIFIPDSTPVTGTFVFPNPVTGNTLKFLSERKKDLTKVLFFNSLGQPINDYSLEETINGYDILLENVPVGIYYLNIYFGSEIKKYKVVKNVPY